MKILFKVFSYLLLFTSLFTACEENIPLIENTDQSHYETVNFLEIKDFIRSQHSTRVLKNNNDLDIKYDIDDLAYEELLNSDASLAVIPAETKYSSHYSRVLLIKVDGEIESVLFSMYKDEAADSASFSGEIMITDLDGNFIDGYRVSEGVFISQFIKEAEQKVQTKNSQPCPIHGECTSGSECIDCTQNLDEVVVTSNSTPPTEYVPLTTIYPQEGGSNCSDCGTGEWNYGGGGTGNSNTGDGGEECSGGKISDGNGGCECPEGFILNGLDDVCVEESIDNVPPSCESFKYYRVGTTNWQTAGVSGIHELFTIFNWDCIGMDWGIFTTPLYFQLPINSTFPEGGGIVALESAVMLHEAFLAFDVWYKRNGCDSNHIILTQRLLDYIKNEFKDAGGDVTTTPPLGFTGKVHPYKISWIGYGDCIE